MNILNYEICPKSQLLISEVFISSLVGWEQAQFHTPCLNDLQVCSGHGPIVGPYLHVVIVVTIYLPAHK